MMTRAVYLIGPPGVGKTTVMTMLLSPYQLLAPLRVTGYTPLWVEPLLDDGRHVGYHLGKTRASFGGTDALSMGVNTAAVRWAREAPLPELVAGEGQRLANARFLGTLADRPDVTLTVIHLSAPTAVLDARCAARGSKQKRAWRQGAATRAANLAGALTEAGHRVEFIDAEDDPHKIAARIAWRVGVDG